VSDVVTALSQLMSHEPAYGEVINVGSQEEVSIVELAERVIDITGSTSRVSLIPYEEAYGEGFEDMHRRIPDTAKVEGMIDWRPARSLDDIIRDVAETARTAALPA
jgi:UDP-glucose 4-epimerase